MSDPRPRLRLGGIVAPTTDLGRGRLAEDVDQSALVNNIGRPAHDLDDRPRRQGLVPRKDLPGRLDGGRRRGTRWDWLGAFRWRDFAEARADAGLAPRFGMKHTPGLDPRVGVNVAARLDGRLGMEIRAGLGIRGGADRRGGRQFAGGQVGRADGGADEPDQFEVQRRHQQFDVRGKGIDGHARPGANAGGRATRPGGRATEVPESAGRIEDFQFRGPFVQPIRL